MDQKKISNLLSIPLRHGDSINLGLHPECGDTAGRANTFCVRQI